MSLFAVHATQAFLSLLAFRMSSFIYAEKGQCIDKASIIRRDPVDICAFAINEAVLDCKINVLFRTAG